MQKKTIKYIAFIAVLLLAAYNSVYFKKLDEVKAAESIKEFNAPAYARNFYTKSLLPNISRAVEINTLLSMVRTAPAKAFKDHSNALGIGNIRYFLVNGEGTITAINENEATIVVKNDTAENEIKIATEFVYGNAIRDAPGLIDINEFHSTMDFNNVSAEINKIIRQDVLPLFKANGKKGDRVKFSGAIELNRAHTSLDHIEVMPISLELIK